MLQGEITFEGGEPLCYLVNSKVSLVGSARCRTVSPRLRVRQIPGEHIDTAVNLVSPWQEHDSEPIELICDVVTDERGPSFEGPGFDRDALLRSAITWLRDHIMPRPHVGHLESRYPGQGQFRSNEHLAGIAHLLCRVSGSHGY